MPFPLLTPAEQSALVARVRAGDRSAEARIAELFSAAIQAMARARTRGAADPHDICQDVLVAVISALRRGQLREAERLGPFVAGVARNIINAELRHQRARPHDALTEDTAPVADLRDEIARREQRRLLAGALEDLSPSDRQILVLTLVHGLKPGQVASQLSLASDVVRARKSRALRRLTERLRGY